MSVYQVGKVMKDAFALPESYDHDTGGDRRQDHWALAQSTDAEAFKKLFYQTINHDLLFC